MPLFPRAANPASEFQAVLDLARASATRHAVADIEDGNYVAALAKLDALAAGSFHWRGAVSNGYQQGFFLYALRGYCLETLGEVVKAYRSYQNSRACFDDETAAVQCSEPRLEVFLGLGRTCLVAGRYTDAFTWLDLVRLEAADLPRLAVAADRGLIRRAIEIGDYHDAITNFWDLQCLLRECGSDLRVANAALDEESGRGSPSHTNRNQCAENDHFARPERNLSREEHKDLAQLYFWTHQDRPGFKTLLDGITLLGIDNDLGVKDPMVEAYLNNIMRADDAEIQRFYDLLGYAILQARGLKADEPYLAFVCKARETIRETYGTLQLEDDFTVLSQRLETVTCALRRSLMVQNTTPKATIRDRATRGASAPMADAGKPIIMASAAAEDLIMQADCRLRAVSSEMSLLSSSLASFYSEVLNAATITAHAVLYDGTTLENAARIQLYRYCTFTGNSTGASSVISRQALCSDTSLRAAEALLLAYPAAPRDLHEWDAVIGRVPAYHACILALREHAVRAHMEANVGMRVFESWASYEAQASRYSQLYTLWIKWLCAHNNFTAAVHGVIAALARVPMATASHDAIFDLTYDLVPLVSPQDLARIAQTVRRTKAPITLLSESSSRRTEWLIYPMLIEAAVSNELRLRSHLASSQFNEAFYVLLNQFGNDQTSGRQLCRARIYLGLGLTNLAFRNALNAHKTYMKTWVADSKQPGDYPMFATTFLEELLPSMDKEFIAEYVHWLKTLLAAREAGGQNQDIAKLDEAIQRLSSMD